MSLTFGLEKCNPLILKDHGYGFNDDFESNVHPVTQALIFATLSVGLDKITLDNIDEFYARMMVCYKLNCVGGVQQKNEETEEFKNRILTEEEVYAHIGLYTNAWPSETRAKWARRLFVNQNTSVTEDLKGGFNRWREEHNKKLTETVKESINA